MLAKVALIVFQELGQSEVMWAEPDLHRSGAYVM